MNQQQPTNPQVMNNVPDRQGGVTDACGFLYGHIFIKKKQMNPYILNSFFPIEIVINGNSVYVCRGLYLTESLK